MTRGPSEGMPGTPLGSTSHVRKLEDLESGHAFARLSGRFGMARGHSAYFGSAEWQTKHVTWKSARVFFRLHVHQFLKIS